MDTPSGHKGASSLNISELIDNAQLTGFQLTILILCALVNLIDGLNTQSIGITAPEMAQNLGLHIGAFAPVFSSALLGAALGALTFGQLGDRFGRKRVLVSAVLLFAVFTVLTAWLTDYDTLIAGRFIAGIGMGGAIPNVVSLNSEFAPKRIRGILVTLQWSAFPLGGTLGGIIASFLIPSFGWKSVFYFGGGAAFVIALALIVLLPELLRYLTARDAPHHRIRAIARRLTDLPLGDITFTSTEEHRAHVHVGMLFAEGRAVTTLILWMIFAITFTILVFTPLWAPSLLVRDAGLNASSAAIIVSLNNFGSMLGGVVLGRLIDYYNPYRVLAVAFVFGTIATGLIGFGGSFPFAGLMLTDFFGGAFIGGAGAGMVVIATAAYPTPLRATGAGWAITMARLGQVSGTLIAGGLIAMGAHAGAIFLTIGCPALLCAAGVLALERRGMIL